jgi:hypothetical protein
MVFASRQCTGTYSKSNSVIIRKCWWSTCKSPCLLSRPHPLWYLIVSYEGWKSSVTSDASHQCSPVCQVGNSLKHCVWEGGGALEIYTSWSYLEQETMLEALIQTEPHYSIVINLYQLVLSFIKLPLISFLATDTVMSLASITLDNPYFKLQWLINILSTDHFSLIVWRLIQVTADHR